MAQIGETELDVQALARALGRKAWILLLITVLVAIATYVGLGFVQPLYTADTRILIEERESPFTRQREQGQPASNVFDESAIQSRVEVLRSREIANAVIDRLNLVQRPEFDPATQPSMLTSLKVMLGLSEPPTDGSIRQRVMENYFKRLNVYALTRSRVIGIEFTAPNAELAAEVANAVADAFITIEQDAKRESAVAATAWLEQEIDSLRERLAEAERSVADYRASNSLFDTSASGDLSTQQLGDLNAELARARAARAEAEARAQLVGTLLAEGAALDSSPEVLDSQLIQRLRERQVGLRAQIAELSTTLLPGHPQIRALEGQVRNLEAQIRLEAQKVQAALETAARIAAARERSLTESLNAAKGDVSEANEQDIQLRALEREATAQRDLLESLLGRYREAVARTDANYLPADARIISRAVPPREPSFPKKAVMALAAALAALLVGCAAVVLREFTSGRVYRIIDGRYPAEPAALVAAMAPPAAAPPGVAVAVAAAPAPVPPVEPVIAEPAPAPVAAEAAATAVATAAAVAAVADEEPEAEPDEEEAEDDSSGTADLGEMLASPAVRVAVFAGAVGGEGAGGIAFAAAQHAAQNKLRLVLIDVGTQPSAALGGYERPGLGDLLTGEAAFGEVIRRDDEARVHVIPMGVRDANAPLQRLQIVVGALTHTYDKVIVVANQLDDWPHVHVRPDLAAIVCGPRTTETLRGELYDLALERGAQTAIIVRYSGESDEAGRNGATAAA